MEQTEILKQDTLRYFHKLCRIPRESGNEQAVSEYICKWAGEHGLWACVDDVFNVIIKKPASPGRESAAPVLLQAHLDMVCDKTPDSTHDFSRDAIVWRIQGDWISSAAGTSLGADCGIGIALIMEVLASRELCHPALEVLLTTREETDMLGAYRVDVSQLTAQRMINLDVSPDNRLLAGSCGGVAIELELPVTTSAVSSELQFMRLTVEGLTGGHSGADIHKGRGNAILLLARALRLIQSRVKLTLWSFEGGNSRLAIPREASAGIAVSPCDATALENAVREFTAQVAEEYASIKLAVRLECAESTPNLIWTDYACNQFLQLCALFPNGVQEMSSAGAGVESSSNLGVVKQTEQGLCFITEARSTYPGTRELLVEKQGLLAKLFGGTIITHSEYPAWIYREHSKLRESVLEVYREREKSEMEVLAVHAGNEIGILASRIEGLDAVAMGPTRHFYHSPEEKLSISSSIHFTGFLHDVLERLCR